MLAPKYIWLLLKYIFRQKVRSFLTIAGVATAMGLFYAVQVVQKAVTEATRQTGKETVLVVYREDRFCPFTSRLPQDYDRKIRELNGVKAVLPIKIWVNNCRASLDVVTFRGIPREGFDTPILKGVRLVEGSLEQWKQRSDGALLGIYLAKRRGLKVGDRLTIGGISVLVSGILESEELQDQNVAYAHLDFIQRAGGNQVGIVTQFNVLIDDPKQIDTIADQIDELFKKAQEPTSTWSEKAFVARAISDVMEIIGFAHWLGWGAIAAVFALVANAIILSIQDRIRDHAIFQTLGFTPGRIARLIIMEAILLSLLGGSLGISLAYLFAEWSQLSLSVEGVSVLLSADVFTLLFGLGLCFLIGILAGFVPALQASQREIVSCFRAV